MRIDAILPSEYKCSKSRLEWSRVNKLIWLQPTRCHSGLSMWIITINTTKGTSCLNLLALPYWLLKLSACSLVGSHLVQFVRLLLDWYQHRRYWRRAVQVIWVLICTDIHWGGKANDFTVEMFKSTHRPSFPYPWQMLGMSVVLFHTYYLLMLSMSNL